MTRLDILRARDSVISLETETHRVQRRIREGMSVADALVDLRGEIARVARELTDAADELTPVMPTSASQSLRRATEILREARDEEPITKV